MPYAQISATDLNNAYFSTLRDFERVVEDQTFHMRPALVKLTRNKKMTSGGLDQVEMRVRAGRNTNGKMVVSDGDTVDFSEQSVGTVARLPLVFLAVPVLHSSLNQSINSGENQIVDLVKETMSQAAETASDMPAEPSDVRNIESQDAVQPMFSFRKYKAFKVHLGAA